MKRRLAFGGAEVKKDVKEALRDVQKRRDPEDRALVTRHKIELLAAAPITLGHADAAEHLGRRLQLHRRNDRQETEHHQGEDDQLFHCHYSISENVVFMSSQ